MIKALIVYCMMKIIQCGAFTIAFYGICKHFGWKWSVFVSIDICIAIMFMGSLMR